MIPAVAARAGALLAVLAWAACLDAPPSGVGAPSPDGARPEDGGDRPDAGPDAAGDPGGNLIANGDFEAGVVGWIGLRADIGEETTDVHSGAGAAWACLDASLGADAIYGLDSDGPVVPAPAAGTYRFEVWVRAGVGASPQPMSLSLRMDPGDVETSPAVAVADTWVPLAFESEVTGSGGLAVRVRAQSASAGDCFIADDVVLTAL